jgi:hypothetical protein
MSPMLLYSVVWYERFGSNVHYRTLANILLSNVCVISLMTCLLFRPFYILMILFAPFPKAACQVLIFFRRSLFICFSVQMLLWQIVKCLHLFRWKYTLKLDDDFWANFLTFLNLFISSLIVLCFDVIGFQHSEVDFHICLGQPPLVSIYQTPFLVTIVGSEDVYRKVTELDPLQIVTKITLRTTILIVTCIWIQDLSKRIRQET